MRMAYARNSQPAVERGTGGAWTAHMSMRMRKETDKLAHTEQRPQKRFCFNTRRSLGLADQANQAQRRKQVLSDWVLSIIDVCNFF